MSTIVKIDVVCDAIGSPASMIIRNQGGTVDQTLPITDSIIKLLGSKSTIYVKAKCHKTNGLKLESVVKDREW